MAALALLAGLPAAAVATTGDATTGRSTEYGDVDGFDTIDAALESDIPGLESTYALIREEMR